MITGRDKELFRKLHEYGMLSTKQVNEMIFKNIAVTTVLRRLRLLEDGHFVKRILGLESQDVLWVLNEKGAAAIGCEMSKRNWSKNLLEHDFKLLKLRLTMEASGVARSWKPEHEIRSMIFKENGYRRAAEKLVPDGLMGVEVNGRKESVAVELELTMKSSARYDQTFRRYAGKERISAIWYVVPSLGALNHIYRRWKKAKGLYGLPELQLSLLNEVMTDPLKARLMGDKCFQIERVWTAHTPAQRVSISSESEVNKKVETSSQNHTPIEEVCA